MKTNTLVSSVTDETSLKIIAYYINNEEISKSSQYNYKKVMIFVRIIFQSWIYFEICKTFKVILGI